MDDPGDGELTALAARLGRALQARGWRMASAESCTGGWIAKAMTDVAGSSGWFDSGFVTYSNAAKARDLGVSETLLARHGAVSEPVVRAMAAGARARTGARLGVAVSGVAGPGGGSEEKPVGTVWFAWSLDDDTRAEHCRYEGGRDSVRRRSVAHVLERALALVEGGDVEDGGDGERAERAGVARGSRKGEDMEGEDMEGEGAKGESVKGEGREDDGGK